MKKNRSIVLVQGSGHNSTQDFLLEFNNKRNDLWFADVELTVRGCIKTVKKSIL